MAAMCIPTIWLQTPRRCTPGMKIYLTERLLLKFVICKLHSGLEMKSQLLHCVICKITFLIHREDCISYNQLLYKKPCSTFNIHHTIYYSQYTHQMCTDMPCFMYSATNALLWLSDLLEHNTFTLLPLHLPHSEKTLIFLACQHRLCL